MFLLHVYHTYLDINDESSDFLIGFMMGLSRHAFCEVSRQCSEYLYEGE